MPQKVTRIVTRFFERCPPFQGKTGKRHIGKICRFDVPAINVKFTDFKCPDSGQMKFISETCFVFDILTGIRKLILQLSCNLKINRQQIQDKDHLFKNTPEAAH